MKLVRKINSQTINRNFFSTLVKREFEFTKFKSGKLNFQHSNFNIN